MTDTDRSLCDRPEPCVCYAGGRDEALQTAVAPKEIDQDDQFD